jgi:uncharacterized protein (UPF0335 family)
VTEAENLVLEHLKRFQTQMSRVEEKLTDVAADVRGIKQHMAAFMTSEANQDAVIASLQHRLERIERRLDLID